MSLKQWDIIREKASGKEYTVKVASPNFVGCYDEPKPRMFRLTEIEFVRHGKPALFGYICTECGAKLTTRYCRNCESSDMVIYNTGSDMDPLAGMR